MRDSWFSRIVLPGLIYQSTIIAGAYGSGRELATFFLPYGPLGGILGMLVSMALFSAVLMASYEFARRFQLFDYRSFTRHLLGRAWLLYEVVYVLSLLLILSVVGAVAGEILRDVVGWPEYVGTIGVMVLIALLVFYGTPAIERFLSLWSFVLYATYILFMGWNLWQHGDAITANLAGGELREGWFGTGIKYAGYNLSLIPALVFCIRHQKKRSDALYAGLLGGPLVMIPAMLFYVAMIGQYDELVAVGDSTLPVTLLLNALQGADFFLVLFPIVLFGTFVETGAAIIHGLNERISHVYEERGLHMQRWLRPAVAVGVLFAAVILADMVGLTSLVADGYGTITFAALAVFVVPVLTLGVWKVYAAGAGDETGT